MAKLKGLTAAQAIELLKTTPPDAVLCGDSGDGTVSPVEKVQLGSVKRYTRDPTYGCSPFLFSEKVDDGGQLVVYIGNF